MAAPEPGGRSTVWIFHGDESQFAAGAFETEAEALAWAAAHGVSGILTEYPLGDGCYDVALREGHFQPSKEWHGTPRQELVAATPSQSLTSRQLANLTSSAGGDRRSSSDR